jgi:hypothetical protein
MDECRKAAAARYSLDNRLAVRSNQDILAKRAAAALRIVPDTEEDP